MDVGKPMACSEGKLDVECTLVGATSPLQEVIRRTKAISTTQSILWTVFSVNDRSILHLLLGGMLPWISLYLTRLFYTESPFQTSLLLPMAWKLWKG